MMTLDLLVLLSTGTSSSSLPLPILCLLILTLDLTHSVGLSLHRLGLALQLLNLFGLPAFRLGVLLVPHVRVCLTSGRGVGLTTYGAASANTRPTWGSVRSTILSDLAGIPPGHLILVDLVQLGQSFLQGGTGLLEVGQSLGLLVGAELLGRQSSCGASEDLI